MIPEQEELKGVKDREYANKNAAKKLNLLVKELKKNEGSRGTYGRKHH